MAELNNSALFEVSWEVCNKVGGINTVIRSKVAQAMETFGDNYYLIGPLLSREMEFEETDEECWHEIRRVLGEKGMEFKCGRWTLPGRPKVILVRAGDRYSPEQLMFRLWESFGVDSIAGRWDYIEPVLFSTACGEVISTLHEAIFKKQETKVFAHFHEWMTGAGLLHVKEHCRDVPTVFTTHATVLGRAMMGSGRDIYKELDSIVPSDEAKNFGVTAKHSLETVTAREADCFTAVSELTAREAHKLLGRRPGVVTDNGINTESIPDLVKNRKEAEASRERLMNFANGFLGIELPESARLIMISGRYEFGNKGIDVFLNALNNLRTNPEDDGRPIVAFLFVLAGHLEQRLELSQEGGKAQAPLICTHRLDNESRDPILNKCMQLGIANSPESPVKAIFVPVYLNVGDGVLDMDYYDVMKGTDLGVYPSKYEPWGYTPLENAVYAVPTITTDQAGFGLWVKELPDVEANKGVIVLDRMGKPDEAVVASLTDCLRKFQHWTDDELLEQRQAARDIALKAGWKDFYKLYRESYQTAASHAEKRAVRREAIMAGRMGHIVPTRVSAQPHFRSFVAERRLPRKIRRLREIANNLWWTWHTRAEEMFARIDPTLWRENGGNPLKLLDDIPGERLKELADNENFVHRYQDVTRALDEYMDRRDLAPELDNAKAISWTHPVAYFSLEYGLHESLPLYSGGLGVLSGDHMKTASDLRIPLIGMGLFYKHGYFRQRIDKDGKQVAEYRVNEFLTLPIEQLQETADVPMTISVEFPGRTLFASIWKLQIGHVVIYLLDTDVPANTGRDRNITDQLYVGDERIRVEQELLLGIGGARALRKLGIEPSLFHLNEGHSAFLILENMRLLMKEAGLSFEEAREVIKNKTVFTTHTPVDAGNERFSPDLIRHYFAHFCKEVGVGVDRVLELGRCEGGEDKPFDMTMLALKTSSKANGVSKLHGAVARRMWEHVWPGVHRSMIPIGSVTNGVHAPTFMGAEMHMLLDTYLGLNWDEQTPESEKWKRLSKLPDAMLWDTKNDMKQRLVAFVRDYAATRWFTDMKTDVSREELLRRINPNALTIGFARRFAPYKRAMLIFQDVERLDRIVNNPRRPVQIYFAGKAHPRDHAGCELVRKVVELSRQDRFAGKIIFLEDYDLHIAKLLVQGVDVWLNTPRRPYEASGTSGMKAGINAGLNLSVADGWWYEAENDENGWTIGERASQVDEDSESDDLRDANHMYALLEDVVVPLFYQRNTRGLPERWIDMMRNALATILPQFNSHRMLVEYYNELYAPCARAAKKITDKNYAAAKEVAAWKQSASSRFSTVHLVDIQISGLEHGSIEVGQSFSVKVRIDVGDLDPSELCVDLVIGKADTKRQVRDPVEVCLNPGKTSGEHANIIEFEGEFDASDKGSFAYGIRVMPYHEGLVNRYDVGLAFWG